MAEERIKEQKLSSRKERRGKWNQVLAHAMTWMNYENITLSERSQVMKTNIRFHLYELRYISKTIETK